MTVLNLGWELDLLANICLNVTNALMDICVRFRRFKRVCVWERQERLHRERNVKTRS